jgi:hypothetical protein
MHQDHLPIRFGEEKLQELQSGRGIEGEKKKGRENQSKSFHESCL